MHKHNKSLSKHQRKFFSQCLENTINTSMTSNHINHTNSRTSEAEWKKILIHYWQQMIYYSWHVMKAWWKLRVIYKNGTWKQQTEGGSIEPLPLNKVSIGLRDRTERAQMQWDLRCFTAINPAALPVSEPDLIKNLTFTLLSDITPSVILVRFHLKSDLTTDNNCTAHMLLFHSL